MKQALLTLSPQRMLQNTLLPTNRIADDIFIPYFVFENRIFKQFLKSLPPTALLEL